jgi:hypothetical protein
VSAQTRTTFAVFGMIDRSSASMIKEAVRTVDPGANVAVSLRTGLASVRSGASVDVIRKAIEAQGFIAEPSTRAFPQRPASRAPFPTDRRAILRVLGRASLWGLASALIVPFATFVAVASLQYFDTSCGTPGNSGGCAMGLVSATMFSIAPGAILGFLTVFVHGIARLGRDGPTP